MEINRAVDALAALAQETRLAAFRLLVQAGANGLAAGEIAERLAVPSSTLSFHLKELDRAGLVRSWRVQRQIRYAADYEGMRRLLTFLTARLLQRPSGDLRWPAAGRGRVRLRRVSRRRRPCMTDVTIYHNPACGTSRNVLGLIRNSGVEPRVIEYLKTPPSRAELVEPDRPHGHPGARPAAPQGHALRRARARRPGADGRPAHRRDDGAPDPDQPADRGDAAGRAGSAARPRRCSTSCRAPQRGAFAKEDGEPVVDAPAATGCRGSAP